MTIKPIDMTTPLNLELIKELKGLLNAINDAARVADKSIATPEDAKYEDACRRATVAVMQKIECLCMPVMHISTDTDPKGSNP